MTTNQELEVMLARLDERQEQRHMVVIEKLDAINTWKDSHQETDTKQFKELNDNIINMRTYASSIAIVASGAGAGLVYIWNKLTGKA